MTFSEYLSEKKRGYFKVHPKLITKEDIKFANEFQSFLKTSWDYFEGKKNAITYNKFKEDVKDYLNRPYARHVSRYIDETDKEIADIIEARNKKKPELEQEYSKHMQDLEQAFLDGDSEKILAMHPKMSELNQIMSKSTESEEEKMQRHNPFNKSGMASLFFGGGKPQMVASFGDRTMKELTSKDIGEHKFSYLKLPKNSDWEFMVYYIDNLQNSKKPLYIGEHDFVHFMDLMSADKEDYQHLKELADKYMHGNDKSLIPQILEELQSNPILNSMNEKSKRNIKIVFRGIGGDEDNRDPGEKKIIEHDKETKFIATSKNRYSAENFALMKGHLESGRRSDWGYIITYEVTPEAIILDTGIFGGLYMEDEILIDATKAKVNSIEVVDSDDDEGYKDEDEDE